MIKRLAIVLGVPKLIGSALLSFFLVAVVLFMLGFLLRFYAWAFEEGWQAMRSLGF